MKTPEEIVQVLSGLADGMVVAHGQDDEYVRGLMDFAEAAAKAFGSSVYFFAPAARSSIGHWKFEKTPASLIVIPPGEMG